MLEIKVLQKADAEAFLALRLQSLQEHPDAYGAAYEEEKDTTLEKAAGMLLTAGEEPGDEFVMGAFAHEVLVGIAGFYRDKRVKFRHKGYIWGVYVVPEWRGLGIGKEMLVELVNLLREMPDLEQINITVAAENRIARQLYLSMNFKPYGVELKSLKLKKGYVDEEHMALAL